MILVDFYGKFPWSGLFFATQIRIRYIEADPDPADQNETDPNGSETLQTSIIKSWAKTVKSARWQI